MKKKTSIIALISVILVSMAITLQNLSPVTDDGYQSPRERAILKQFDKDGDGELSEEERKAVEQAAAERKMAIIQKFDKNGDGKISKEEEMAIEQLELQRKNDFIKRFDKDGNGKLSNKEKASAKADRK